MIATPAVERFRYLNSQAHLYVALVASVGITFSTYCPASAAPIVPKPLTKAPVATADDRLQAALRDPALAVSLSGRRASVSKLFAYVEARKAAEAAYDAAVADAKQAHRAAPADPFHSDREPDYYQMYLQELRERAFPRDTVDTAALVRAENHRDAMRGATNVRHSVSIRGIDAATLAANPSLYLKPSVSRGIAPGVSALVAPAQWESVGPKNMLNGSGQQTYFGPITANFSGRINGMAVSPTDANTVFVATAGGGVWKTSDAGVTWAPIADAFLARQETNTIAIDPFNPQNILVGLGDAQGGEGSGTGRGMLRSTDGGATWTAIPMVATGIVGDAVSVIVFDKDTAGIVVATTATYAGTTGYRWRSTDGGVTWTRIEDVLATTVGGGTRWTSLSASPRDTAANRRFYYATGMSSFAAQAGLWRSADQGQTWTQITLPPAFNGGTVSYTDGFRAVASAVDPNIVYVLRASDKALIKGVCNPANDTYAWTEISGIGTPGQFNQLNWGQTFYNVYMNCAAQTVNGVVKDALYPSIESINCALGVSDANWTPNWVDFGKAYQDGSLTHADNHFSVVAPSDPSRVYVGNDGGFYPVTYDASKSASPTLDTWTITQGRNAAMPTTLFFQADFHPYNASYMIGGLQDNGATVATGDLSNWRTSAAGDGSGAAQDATNPLRSYILTNSLSVNYTQDGWANKVDKTPAFGATDARPLIGYCGINPNYPNEFYLGSNYLWRYSPLKGAWEPRLGNVSLTGTNGDDGGNGGLGIRAITVAPSKASTLYVGASNSVGVPASFVWASFDNGKNWTKISANSNNTLPNRVVTSISVSPTNDKDVLVTLSGTGGGHVYRCADTSQPVVTFQDVSGTGATGLPDGPFNTLARDFTAPDGTWYAGADTGVYQTQDGGQTWTNATQPLGLPAVSVRTLKAMPGTGYLMAATYGRAIWRIPLVSPLPTNTSGVKARFLLPQTLSWAGSFGDGSYNYAVPFTVANIGGVDATNVTITAFKVTVNGADATPDASLTLPVAYGTVKAGAGSVSRSFTVKSNVFAPGAKYPATVNVNGNYTDNGVVKPFEFTGRVEFIQ